MGEFSQLKPKNSKPTILLLSDDMRFHSGIATMSREFVVGTAHIFNWVQLGGGINHPDRGKVFDVSEDVNKERNISDANVKIIPWSGYGDPFILRKLLEDIKPAAVLHFTDPRFWQWLYAIENEVRQHCPLCYYSIWDDLPIPHYNLGSYASCDLIMGISKQSHNIHKEVLKGGNIEVIDLDVESRVKKGAIYTSYVPHGISSKHFRPITPEDPDYEEFVEFKKNFNEHSPSDFIVFWNNRNVRRKQPGDVILAFKEFNRLVKQFYSGSSGMKSHPPKNVTLFMHTQIRDENGTDLEVVHQDLAPECRVVFSDDRISTKTLNFYYNLADVTLNIASNEGFGLSGAESLMAGTMIINNVTGGLQDQCRFEDEEGKWIDFNNKFTTNHTGRFKSHGSWAVPVFPASRSLQGSIPTPYIFDDRCRYEDVADALYRVFTLTSEERFKRGLAARQWMIGSESRMSAESMSKSFIKHLNFMIQNWTPACRHSFEKITPSKSFISLNAGIV